MSAKAAIAKALDPESLWPNSVWKLGRVYTPGVLRFLENIEPLSEGEVSRLYNSHAHLSGKGLRFKVLFPAPGVVTKDAVDDLRASLNRSVEVALDLQEQATFQNLARDMNSVSYSAGNNHESTRAANQFNMRLGEVVFSRPSDPQIVEWARQQSGRLIVEINEALRSNIAGIVADGIRQQLGVQGTARRIRDLIGLTQFQSAAALRHRQEMIQSGFAGIRLEQAYNRYLKKKIRERAELIANNEIHVAVATGQNSKALALGRTMKDWITVGDNRVDPNICRPNEAMGKIPISQTFPNSNTQTTPGHIRCRCTCNYYGGTPSQVFRELRNPRRSSPATTAPRPAKPPKPPKLPKPPKPVVYGKADFEKLGELFDSVNMNQITTNLEDAGKKFYEVWNQNVKMSPSEFFGKLMNGVSKGGDLKLKFFDPTGYEYFEYKYKNAAGLDFTRVIDFRKKVVDHEYFEIAESAQASGIGKRLLGNSMELYEKMGIKKITVHANIDVGGYAWAKYGFELTNERGWGEMVKRLERRLEGTAFKDVKDDVKTVLKETDTKTIWKISDMNEKLSDGKTIGKALLLGENWYGQLSLSDPKAMTRFKAYVSKGK